MWGNGGGGAEQLSAIVMPALIASLRCKQQVAIPVCKHLCWFPAGLSELAQIGIGSTNFAFCKVVL